MADAPDWGFDALSAPTRWVLAYGLPSTLTAPALPLDESSFGQLLTECRSHRLDGHLISAVAKGDLPVTTEQRRAIAEVEIDLTRMRCDYDDVVRPVLDSLVRAKIPFRLLKGSSLGWVDYPDPQLRPTADLDLLVRGADLIAAADHLIGLGADPVNPEPVDGFALRVFKGLTVTMPTGLEVDLHRLLSWGPFGVRVPEADLWSPGRRFDRLGQTATTLDVERTLIHMCAHLLLLGAVRASEVRDVGQLATSPKLDPERTVDIAQRWGQQAILATALRMAERELQLTSGAHPLSGWAAHYQPTARDLAWLRVDNPINPTRGVEPAAVLIELPGLRAKATMLRATIAPRPGTDPSFLTRIRRRVNDLVTRP